MSRVFSATAEPSRCQVFANHVDFSHLTKNETSISERIAVACRMNESTRQIIWSSIPQSLYLPERLLLFLERLSGQSLCNSQ